MGANTGDLAAILAAPGPFATVYLGTAGAVEQAQDHVDVRWKNLRRELAASGAPDHVLDAIDPLTVGAHEQGECLAVVANAGGVVYAAHEPDPPERDVARWAPLPYMAPLFEWRQSMPAHVVVRADREGADIIAFERGRRTDVEEAGGGRDPLHKAAPGGWSQRRFQQRAENVWEANAKDVADEVTKVAEETEARLVVVAGDVRAVQLLRENLPERLDRIVHEVEGQRALDSGSIEGIADDVVRLVATAVAEDTVALLAKFREERGQHDRASDGIRATVDALNQARVATLLVHDDPDDERTAWFGEDPVPIGLGADELKGFGLDTVEKGRLVDCLIRAATGTGAEVRIVPSTGPNGPSDGVGAILRY